MVSPRRTTNAAPSVAGITTCFPSGIVRPSFGDFLLMVLLFSFCRYREDRGGSIQTRRLEQSARFTGLHPRLVGSNRCPPLPRASPARPGLYHIRSTTTPPSTPSPNTPTPSSIRTLRWFIVTSALVLAYDVDAIGFGTRWACPVRDLALDGHQGRIAGAE